MALFWMKQAVIKVFFKLTLFLYPTLSSSGLHTAMFLETEACKEIYGQATATAAISQNIIL